MPVKLQGQHPLPASRQVVWRAITDPKILAATLVGCERLERVAENQFEGLLKIKVGPVEGQFQGGVTLSELDPPSSYHMVIKGQGPSGFVEGHGSVRLEEAEGVTTLHYDVEAQVGGRIAGVGQRLLDSSSKVVTRQALESLGRQVAALAAAEQSGGDAAEVPAAAGPSQGELAAELVKGVAADLVPPKTRMILWIVLAAALLGAVWWCLRG